MTSIDHAASNHVDVRILVSPLPVVPQASPAIPPPVDDNANYPDCLLCPLTLFPPEHPVYLDIPKSKGGTRPARSTSTTNYLVCVIYLSNQSQFTIKVSIYL
jgi:hypothetical protein